MATFAFSGRTRGGEAVAGERMGDSMEAVAAALRREQIQVTRISPIAVKAIPKLKGRGVPNLGRRGRGDLFLTVQVITPQDLSKEQRKLLEEVARLREEPAGKKAVARGTLRRPGRAR